MIYLHAPLATILERIQTRGRPKERDTDPAYFAALHARYEGWIGGFAKCPVLTIDVRDYDLIANPDSAEQIAARVRGELEGELPQTELWPKITTR
jgi:deoxyadenosine/deoxycytidine kinase